VSMSEELWDERQVAPNHHCIPPQLENVNLWDEMTSPKVIGNVQILLVQMCGCKILRSSEVPKNQSPRNQTPEVP
jgi:hypothetical protein